jgi:hypothetical protein
MIDNTQLARCLFVTYEMSCMYCRSLTTFHSIIIDHLLCLVYCMVNMNQVQKIIRHEEDCLLGSCTVLYGRILLMFQRCLLPPSSLLMREAAGTSKTSVNFDQTTWHNIPEHSCFHTYCHESLKLCYVYAITKSNSKEIKY